MTTAHWLFLLFIVLSLLLMLCFSLRSQPKTRGYRFVSRIFWATAALTGAKALGLLSWNPVTIAAASVLGAPGLAAMLALRGL